MNQTIWDGFGLEKLLKETIYDFVGSASLVIKSSSGKVAVGAEVVVHFGRTFVTRKLTDSAGSVNFAGWAGRKAPMSHAVVVRSAENETALQHVQLVAGSHQTVTITLRATTRVVG